jgi:polysaccharide deacetylase family protein (PEP-CTERM system associated)
MSVQNILTLDIEDWYQSSLAILGPEHADVPQPLLPGKRVVTNTHRLLAILDEYDVRATCFVLGTVAETYPDLVREIQAAGHEIATHGYGHELVYRLSPREFTADLRKSIELLESITSQKVRGYRAPYFSITRQSKWALDVLANLGLEYDSSIVPIRRRLYGFPGWESFPHIIHAGNNHPLLELPVSTVSFLGQNIPLGGGGYFRLLPYLLVQQAIRAINRQGQRAVFYLHPYELDADELRHPLPVETWKTRLVRLSQRLNRGKTEAKLRRLLADFEWTSVRGGMAEQI